VRRRTPSASRSWRIAVSVMSNSFDWIAVHEHSGGEHHNEQ
jgi:hypothetical protein